MLSDKEGELKSRILSEMTKDYSNILDRNFDLAKQFIRLSEDGKVEVKLRDKLTGPDQIVLYLIGKLYAKEAGLTDQDNVSNQELLEELGIIKNSLWPWLKELRDNNLIKQVKVGKYKNHYVQIHVVERILKDIDKKIKKQETK